jgi:hypothetical protein
MKIAALKQADINTNKYYRCPFKFNYINAANNE